MSVADPTAVRAIALSEAVKHFEKHGGDVIATAAMFLAFLNGTESQPAATTTPTKASTKPPKAEVKKSEPKPEPEAEPGITKEQIGLKIEALLKANKRKPAVALLASLDGATNASSLDEKHYEAFMAGAEEILLSA
jgi:hypothetical protein